MKHDWLLSNQRINTMILYEPGHAETDICHCHTKRTMGGIQLIFCYIHDTAWPENTIVNLKKKQTSGAGAINSWNRCWIPQYLLHAVGWCDIVQFWSQWQPYFWSHDTSHDFDEVFFILFMAYGIVDKFWGLARILNIKNLRSKQKKLHGTIVHLWNGVATSDCMFWSQCHTKRVYSSYFFHDLAHVNDFIQSTEIDSSMSIWF